MFKTSYRTDPFRKKLDHCFLACPCYNKRTYNPMVEKSGGQNITTFENQGKKLEMSDH